MRKPCLKDRGFPRSIITEQQKPIGDVICQGIPQMDFEIFESFKVLQVNRSDLHRDSP
jgi:hypothetical protein